MLSLAHLIFVSMISFAAASHESCVGNCTYAASDELLSTMTLRLYKTSYEDCVAVPITDPMKLLSEIDNNKSIHIFVYGWIHINDLGTTRTLVNAYLFRNTTNIVLLDWAKISNTLYVFAKRSAEGVGYYLAQAINKLREGGLNKTGLTFVGHSLGAQIVGFAARYLDFKLPRITALDPAGPGFYVLEPSVNPDDADCVVAIHTDRAFFGINSQVGQADFYANGGFRPQPGCLTSSQGELCSHIRALLYYAESLINVDAFIGRPCTTYQGFKAGSCSPAPNAIMGYGTPTTANGRYYLQTNDKSTYGRGERGATYQIKGN